VCDFTKLLDSPIEFPQDGPGRLLVEVTNKALELGINACSPGRPFKDIGRVIHHYVCNDAGDFCVSSQFSGHGIGTVFHRPPWILHHCKLFHLCRYSRVQRQLVNDEPGVMLPGHCFTIEVYILLIIHL
jgi:methionyl aminopeptidase